MKAKTLILTVAAVIALSTAYFAVNAMANRGNGEVGYVYVTGQGLWYETFVPVSSLPHRGRFQKLELNGTTEFGPGDPGYLGGRWWKDLNGNNIQDEEDEYLLCPLLPPGYEELPEP